jgi:organic radical activating enzyme
MAKEYKIHEIFNSFQGEFPYTGRRATFIRFYKCNLDCPFCDTMYTPYTIDYTPVSIDKIIDMVSKTNFVTYTGGEPLLFSEEIIDINKQLAENNVYLDKISIETNGALMYRHEDIYDSLLDIFKTNINNRLNIIWSPKFLDDKTTSTMFTVLYENYDPNYMYIKIVANPEWDEVINKFISTAIKLYGTKIKPRMSLMLLSEKTDSGLVIPDNYRQYAIELASKYNINLSGRLHVELDFD